LLQRHFLLALTCSMRILLTRVRPAERPLGVARTAETCL
jgi:hypothetical protein